MNITHKDIVCGMDVSEDTEFHSEHCKNKFDSSPDTYLHTKERASTESCSNGSCNVKTSPLSTNTQYTCPMHPGIIREKPGSCPNMRYGT